MSYNINVFLTNNIFRLYIDILLWNSHTKKFFCVSEISTPGNGMAITLDPQVQYSPNMVRICKNKSHENNIKLEWLNLSKRIILKIMREMGKKHPAPSPMSDRVKFTLVQIWKFIHSFLKIGQLQLQNLVSFPKSSSKSISSSIICRGFN